MQKILLISFFIVIAVVCYSDDKVLHDNPGFLKSPGFIGIGGTTIYGSSGTRRDSEIRPFFIGMLNLIQSEYGNIGLSYGFIPITPHKYYNTEDVSFKMSAQQYSNEFGLNYLTGSKSFNFFLGAGYSANYLTTQLRNFSNNGVDSSFQKSYSQWVYGWQYYFGFEYVLTRDGKWGLFFLFRGAEPDRARFQIDEIITFKDGTSIHYTDDLSMNLYNKSYTLGVIYRF